jgi:predicted ATPase with chaperone activity
MNAPATEPQNSPHLPQMVAVGDVQAPQAPAGPAEAGVDPAVLANLALRAAYTVPNFTSEWAARRLSLPLTLIGEVLEQLRADRLLDVLGQAGPFGYRYSISQNGRERAGRLLEVSGYVGPAPVSLEAYAAVLEWQSANAPPVLPEHVTAALSGLVLPGGAELTAGLAVADGRSLFVYGPPGNGKTSLGRALHTALQGDLWVPHCVAIDESIIRVYDPQVHQAVDLPASQTRRIDRRWVRVRRPLIVVGGELTLDTFDLSYSPTLRYYEAPPHVKANGGTLLLDDFGRQRVGPHELLNRWIIPLEHQIDYLTLHTGRRVQVPLRELLVIATNLKPEDVTDPAFLRRMGYRLFLDKPDPARYAKIFQRYADGLGIRPQPGVVERLLRRYQAEGRDLRCCEPRDLIERARAICRFRDRPPELTEEVLDLAWSGYFGMSGASEGVRSG